MKWYLVVFIMFILHGCKDTVEVQIRKERLLMENKKYFNSERAAKILYEESSKYFKFGTFLYPRPQTRLIRYIVLGDEPPYHIKIITKNQAKKIEQKNGFYVRSYIDKDNREVASFANGMLLHRFDTKNKKIIFETEKNMSATTTLYVTSCHLGDGENNCLTREDSEDWLSYGQENPPLFTNKAFKNYAKYYNGKEIIYDNQSTMVKKIDYKNKKIKYYFYEDTKRYEVICDYMTETCKIKLKLSKLSSLHQSSGVTHSTTQ